MADANDSSGSDNEVEEEGRPDEFFDVLDILDGRADPLSDDEPSAPPPRQDEISHASSDEQEEEQEADDDGDQDMGAEEAGQFAPSDDETDVDALDDLGQFISNLDPSTKRKNSEDDGVIEAEGNAPRKKRKLLKERNEAGAENEFAASGEPESDLCGIPLHSNTWVLQAKPSLISRIFSLRLQANPTAWTPLKNRQRFWRPRRTRRFLHPYPNESRTVLIGRRHMSRRNRK